VRFTSTQLADFGGQHPLEFLGPAHPQEIRALRLPELRVVAASFLSIAPQLLEVHTVPFPARVVGLQFRRPGQPLVGLFEPAHVREDHPDVARSEALRLHLVRPPVLLQGILPVTPEVVDHADIVDSRHVLRIHAEHVLVG